MLWHTDLIIPEQPFQLSLNSSLLMLGSCFTEHLGRQLQNFQLQAVVNPNGNIFHPLALAQSLKRGIEGRIPEESELFKHLGVWRHFDFHSAFSVPDKLKYQQVLGTAVHELKTAWQSATHVEITFGTAWGYVHQQTDKLVANNHKLPAHAFTKSLSTIPEIVEVWDHIIKSQDARQKQWLFTLSPVRHLRDGIMENSRSKAILIEAIHQLAERNTQVTYFPAFEIMIDDLRDYRFYEADMMHPNAIAVEYIRNKFLTACTQPEVREWINLYQPILAAKKHKPLFPNTEEHQHFLEKYRKLVEQLQIRYPMMSLDADLQFFT